MVGKIAALHADGMDFLDVLGDCHETRDRTERLAHEVGVKTCHDDSFTLVCKCLGHLDEIFWLANCALFSLLMSSSVLPENIEPHITSMQPDFIGFSEYMAFV